MLKDPQPVEYIDVELNRQEQVLAEWEALRPDTKYFWGQNGNTKQHMCWEKDCESQKMEHK